jgi:hypothetical protein
MCSSSLFVVQLIFTLILVRQPERMDSIYTPHVTFSINSHDHQEFMARGMTGKATARMVSRLSTVPDTACCYCCLFVSIYLWNQIDDDDGLDNIVLCCLGCVVGNQEALYKLRRKCQS